MQRLVNYTWPGNIRELQNVIERAILLSPSGILQLAPDFCPAPAAPVPAPRAVSANPIAHPPVGVPSQNTPAPLVPVGSIEEVERRHIEAVLAQTNWMIEGERGAAKILNLNPSTLRSRMQKLGIKRP